MGLPSSASPWLLVIQPSNGLWDSRAENKTHANVWPGSPASPPAIENHSSQVQPTWSLIYQWEALLSQHSDTYPSSRQRALSFSSWAIHTVAPCPGEDQSPSPLGWRALQTSTEKEQRGGKERQRRREKTGEKMLKKRNDREVWKEKDWRRWILHRAPEGYGDSSCCVLMCGALVFSVMLISLCFFVVLAGVC